MEENHNIPASCPEFAPPPKISFSTGPKELIFGLCAIVSGLMLFNSMVWGGFNLGFAIAAVFTVLCSAAYLLLSGCSLTPYSGTLLALSILIAAGFGWSSDGFVKFVMVCFLLVCVNLGLCLLAGQNLRNTGSVSSVLDAFRALFALGMGKFGAAFEGLRLAFLRTGSLGQKSGAVLVGLLAALPVLAIVIPLLIQADAAFSGLVNLLPEFDFAQSFYTLLWGCLLGCIVYVRGVALRHNPKEAPASKSSRKGIHMLTVNTVLGAVCAVYLIYLLSQSAYFIGGFAGILPAEYTLAQYARRGFFEMAWLCAVNLGIITVSVTTVRQKPAPLSTRLLCLFIGIVTLFLVATASAKMFLYIGSYGLTRLRVLTQTIMLWLGLTTALVTIHLFVPKFGYMKAVILCALVIGAVLLWADVDTLVARYNVNAYFSGSLETVDVDYLMTLSDGSVPYIEELAQQAGGEVSREAKEALEIISRYRFDYADFRGWNYISGKAAWILENYKTASETTDYFP